MKLGENILELGGKLGAEASWLGAVPGGKLGVASRPCEKVP